MLLAFVYFVVILFSIYSSIFSLAVTSQDIPDFLIVRSTWIFALGLYLLIQVFDIDSCDGLIRSCTRYQSVGPNPCIGLILIVEIKQLIPSIEISTMSIKLGCNLYFQIFVSWEYAYWIFKLDLCIPIYFFLWLTQIMIARFSDDSLFALNHGFLRS